MGEFTVTDINTDMGHAFTIGIEEYKIARSHLVAGHGRAHLILGAGLMGQVNADLIKNIHCKSGAIKPVSRCTAGHVFGSDGFVDHFIHFGIGESASCSDGEDNGQA